MLNLRFKRSVHLFVLLPCLFFGSCKPRGGSSLLSNEDGTPEQKMYWVAAFESFARASGFHINASEMFGKIHSFIESSADYYVFDQYQVAMASIKALATEMLRRDFPDLAETPDSTSRITISGLLEKMALGPGKSPATCQLPEGERRPFRVCYSYDTCEIAISTLGAFKGVEHSAHHSDQSSRVSQRWREIRDDIACLPTSTRATLLDYLAESGALKHEFYKFMHFEITERPMMPDLQYDGNFLSKIINFNGQTNYTQNYPESVSVYDQAKNAPESFNGQNFVGALAGQIARMERFYLMIDDPNRVAAIIADDLLNDFGMAPALKSTFSGATEEEQATAANLGNAKCAGEDCDEITVEELQGETSMDMLNFEDSTKERVDSFISKVIAAHSMNRAMHFYMKRALVNDIRPWLDELRTTYTKWLSWHNQFNTQGTPRPPTLDHVSPGLAFSMLAHFAKWEVFLPFRHEYVERMKDTIDQMAGFFKVGGSFGHGRKKAATGMWLHFREAVKNTDRKVIDAAKTLGFYGVNLLGREKDIAVSFPPTAGAGNRGKAIEPNFHSLLYSFQEYGEALEKQREKSLPYFSQVLLNESFESSKDLDAAVAQATDAMMEVSGEGDDSLAVLTEVNEKNSLESDPNVVANALARNRADQRRQVEEEMRALATQLQSRGELGRTQAATESIRKKLKGYLEPQKDALAARLKLACVNFAMGMKPSDSFDTENQKAIYQCNPVIYAAMTLGRAADDFETTQGFSGEMDLKKVCGFKLDGSGRPIPPLSLLAIDQRAASIRADENLAEICHSESAKFRIMVYSQLFSIALMPVMGHVGGIFTNFVLQRVAQLSVVQGVRAGAFAGLNRLAASRLGALIVRNRLSALTATASSRIAFGGVTSFLSALVFQAGTRAAQLGVGMRPNFWDERGFWGDFMSGVGRDTLIFFAFGGGHKVGTSIATRIAAYTPTTVFARQAISWGVPFGTTTIFFAEIPRVLKALDTSVGEYMRNKGINFHFEEPGVEEQGVVARYSHAMAMTAAFQIYHSVARNLGAKMYQGPEEWQRIYAKAKEMRDFRLSSPERFSRRFETEFDPGAIAGPSGESGAPVRLKPSLAATTRRRVLDFYWQLGIPKERAFQFSKAAAESAQVTPSVHEQKFNFRQWQILVERQYLAKQRQWKNFEQKMRSEGKPEKALIAQQILKYLEKGRDVLKTEIGKENYDAFIFEGKWPDAPYGNYGAAGPSTQNLNYRPGSGPPGLPGLGQ